MAPFCKHLNFSVVDSVTVFSKLIQVSILGSNIKEIVVWQQWDKFQGARAEKRASEAGELASNSPIFSQEMISAR